MKARMLVTRIQKMLVLVLFLVVVLSANGQVESGRFVGRITDAQGASVPHAIVKATNTGTNIVQSAYHGLIGRIRDHARICRSVFAQRYGDGFSDDQRVEY